MSEQKSCCAKNNEQANAMPSDDVVTGASRKSYRPIVAIFGMTLLMAVANAGFLFYDAKELMLLLERFIAFSMCVLAILKLKDLAGFAVQFKSYDLLARKWEGYGYIYPFAEALVGLGMIAGAVFTPIIAPIALFIGSIGAGVLYNRGTKTA